VNLSACWWMKAPLVLFRRGAPFRLFGVNHHEVAKGDLFFESLFAK
jgi:hypothetical protein